MVEHSTVGEHQGTGILAVCYKLGVDAEVIISMFADCREIGDIVR